MLRVRTSQQLWWNKTEIEMPIRSTDENRLRNVFKNLLRWMDACLGINGGNSNICYNNESLANKVKLFFELLLLNLHLHYFSVTQ